MGWSKYGLVALLLVVQGVVGIFGNHAGYTVNGSPYAGAISSETPGIFGVVEWVWDSLTFMFHMTTFQVDGMPPALGLVFILMGLLTVYLIINLIRGGS